MTDKIYSLIADLACELGQTKHISNHQRSSLTEGLNSYEIANLLSQETGSNYGENLFGWANWALEEHNLDTKTETGALMLACRIIGKVANKKGGFENIR